MDVGCGGDLIVEVDGIVDVLEEPVFDLLSAAAEDLGEFDGSAFLEAWLTFEISETARDFFDFVCEFFEIVFGGFG